MTILNPDHLFGQARQLIQAPIAGPPRQVNLRRAISAAYYGVFHHVLASVADEFIGSTFRTTASYTLVYRSIDHKTLRQVCEEVKKTTPVAKYAPYIPQTGVDSQLIAFAAIAIELQEKRHIADYDPRPRFKISDVELVIGAAEDSIKGFSQANPDHRKTFLTLLLCPPR